MALFMAENIHFVTKIYDRNWILPMYKAKEICRRVVYEYIH